MPISCPVPKTHLKGRFTGKTLCGAEIAPYWRHRQPLLIDADEPTCEKCKIIAKRNGERNARYGAIGQRAAS